MERPDNRWMHGSTATLCRCLKASKKPVISRKQPRQLALMPSDQRELRFEEAQSWRQKGRHDLHKMDFHDWTSL